MSEKIYVVTAEVTISLSKEISASSAEAAVEIAKGLRLSQLCWQCAGDQDDETWDLSGELDGTPMHIEIED